MNYPLDLDLDVVRCFVAVAQTGNFTRAASRVSRSQSAVSVRVQRLEEVLGARLFDRNSRTVALTSHGERFFSYALQMLALNDEAVGQIRGAQLAGQLRLGVVEYFAPNQLGALLARARRLMPRLELSVRIALSGELLALYDAASLDLVLVKHQPERQGGRPLLTERLVWVQAAQSEWTGESVPLCLLPSPCAFRSAAIAALTEANRRWHEAITVSSILGVQACVRAGLGVSVLGESSVTRDLQVLEVPGQWPALPDLHLSLYGQENDLAARKIVELLVEGAASPGW